MNLFKCNTCNIKRCTQWVSKKVAYEQYENICLKDDTSKCTSYQKDMGLRVPMLLHLLSTNEKTGGANGVLKEFKLRIREKTMYPWFELLIDKR